MSTDHAASVPWPVFLIDDDEVVLRACVQTLKLADIRVRSFPSAERALGLLRSLPAERNTITEGWEALGMRAGTAAQGV